MVAKVTPFLMFEGRAEEAFRFYVSTVPNSELLSLERYGSGESGAEGSVKFGAARIGGQMLRFIDSSVKHAFVFTPSMSLFVECSSEGEIDTLFAVLIEGGQALMPLGSYGFSKRFGWLNDRFGLSWQLNLA